MQEIPVSEGIEAIVVFEHGAIGQARRGSQGLAPQSEGAFEMKLLVKLPNSCRAQKRLRIFSTAEETGAVTCGQGRNLIKEKQRGVAQPHGFVVLVFPVQLTANPMPAGPAAFAQGFIITVKFATTIAHHGATLRCGDYFTVWLYAILQGHRAVTIYAWGLA